MHKIKNKVKNLLILFTFLLIILGFIFLFLFNKYALPALITIGTREAVTKVNTAISNNIRAEGLKNRDIFITSFDSTGKLTYLEINSLKVNELCTDVAEGLSKELNSLSNVKIAVPLGSLTPFAYLAPYGIKIPFSLKPVGSASADYETAMDSAGIGQVNFRLWLVVKARVDIVCPLYTKPVEITRKLMVVNTVFSGEVPDNFYGVGKQ